LDPHEVEALGGSTSSPGLGWTEAFEIPGHTWAVAVQWHPEVTAARDPSQQGMFDSLVSARLK